MLVAVVSDERGGGVLCPLDADRSAGRPGRGRRPIWPPRSPPARPPSTRAGSGRTAAAVYPPLLRAGVRVDRCHDVELTEALLLGHAGRWGEPRSLAAAWARLTGAAVPPDPPPRAAAPPGHGQGALFDTAARPAGPGHRRH